MTKGLALINFEVRAKENREATMKAGHFVAKDVDFAVITPIGGNLTVDMEVTDDLLKQWKASPETRYRVEAYTAWKDGAEPPVNGSDLKNWPPMTPAMLKGLRALNIRSVEELADLPDAALTRIGPGSRAMRDKAKEWINASGNLGKVVEELAALKAEIGTLKADNQSLRAKLATKKDKAA